MKFRDFLLKQLLADTDYLVGYDNDGNYIRISKDDLASSVAANVTVPTLQVQYSSNATTWHDSYASGDIFLRIKVGSNAWTSAIRIIVSAYDVWREQGNSGDESVFLESVLGSTIYTSHGGIIDSPVIYIDDNEDENHVILDFYSNNVYAYAGKSTTLEINIGALVKHLGKKQHITICNVTKETLTVNIVNGGRSEDLLLAVQQHTLNAGDSLIMEILTTGVVELDEQCCADGFGVDYVTTVCSHIVSEIVNAQL